MGRVISVGKGQWVLVIASDLFCNNISDIHNRTAIGNNTGIIARVCLIDVNKTQDNTEVDEQMCWETEWNPPQDGVTMENNRPEEGLDLINNLLIIVLSHLAQTYEVRLQELAGAKGL